MPKIYEFMCGNDGDESVGIFPYRERITLILHDSKDGKDDEEKELFQQSFAEHADGWCVPLEDWNKRWEQEAINEALEHMKCEKSSSIVEDDKP